MSFKIITTTSVRRLCFTTQHQTCKTKTKTKTDFLFQTGLVPRPTVSDHITGCYCESGVAIMQTRLSAVRMATVRRAGWLRRLTHVYIIGSCHVVTDPAGRPR